MTYPPVMYFNKAMEVVSHLVPFTYNGDFPWQTVKLPLHTNYASDAGYDGDSSKVRISQPEF